MLSVNQCYVCFSLRVSQELSLLLFVSAIGIGVYGRKKGLSAPYYLEGLGIER